MSKYILTIGDLSKNNAGPKAKEDIVYFLEDEGFLPLPLGLKLDPADRSLGAKLRKLYDVKVKIPHVFKKLQADVIVLQYPIYSTYLTTNIIEAIRRYTDAKLYLVIHDVETLRLFKDNKDFTKSEIAVFNSVDGIIDHNHKMHSWIEKQGVTTPCVDIGIFDYHNPTKIHEEYEYDRSLVFAGNLAKSKFLTSSEFGKLGFKLVLFGPAPAENYAENISYQGVYSPEKLPKYLKQNFGLVWDGNSIAECDGTFGEYTKYNNPHKASLYLSSGLPIIVWKEAALADFVNEHNVGFAVGSLSEIDKYLARISQEEYSVMKKNALALAQKIRNGEFIKGAMTKLESVKD
ncbi:MAG: beta-1,6-galactofuranosyltransferase [Ligilactobacillus sp.]|nr:beta-1,6-galactofuranosyltransferase [Ligilactobacillus sp.]